MPGRLGAVVHTLLEPAAAREQYHKKAMPLWNAFSPKLQLARAYAKTKKLTAFESFLRAFAAHGRRHAAAAKAGAPGVTK